MTGEVVVGQAHDVAVVGDGPAGSALARQLAARGVDVVLIGTDRPWGATYASWIDDLDGVPALGGEHVWRARFDAVSVRLETQRTIRRGYGVLDNDALRAVLRADVTHRIDTVTDVDELGARIVIDATGWPSGLDRTGPRADVQPPPCWQSAFGTVLDAPPEGSLGTPTIMDYGEPPDRGDLALPSFAYAIPVVDGWLVEETILAGPAVDVDRLAPRLASRLGLDASELVRRARRLERVRIPMGVSPPPRRETSDTVRFGAVAGMIHPASGYSVAASLRASDRVAAAIATRLDAPRDPHADRAAAADAVWPKRLRRTQRLQAYGLDVLLGLDADQLRSFFEAFFELSPQRWADYLRIDTGPGQLAGIMLSVFGRADGPLRRALLGGDPRRLVGALAP